MQTLSELRQDMKDDLGLGQKDWVDNDDLDSYIRRAVRQAHSEILTLYEDYFLESSEQELLGSQSKLEYPENCYANKIRTIVFTNAPIGSRGTYVAKINSFKNITKVTEFNMLYADETSDCVRQWIPESTTESIFNDSGVKIGTQPVRSMKLVPSTVSEDGHAVIWYIRKPITLTSDDDVCDILEFCDYVLSIAKRMYYEQDGDQNYTTAVEAELKWKERMINTLGTMKCDENNEFEQDLSFHCDSLA